MHLQNPVPGWTAALLALPDGACVKAFHGSTLREAKQSWAAAGRDPAKLITVFRFNDHEAAPAGTWEQAVAHQRGQFARWVDGTYLDQFAPFVDLVQGANEHTANSTWADPADKARALQSERAAAYVWSTDYRGRLGIPAGCRLTLLSGPVSNDVPREICELSIQEDCPIDYHAYTRWYHGARSPVDWTDDSGRWHRHELAYGLRPAWFFGECGPYINASDGWRHPDVLGGDVNKLVGAMRAWYADVAHTPAYREGRIVGQGAWFTSGNAGWPWYELEADQLVRLAELAAAVWHPGEDADMDRVRIEQHARAIVAEVTGQWWQAWPEGEYGQERRLANPRKVLNIYRPDGTLLRTMNVQWEMDVTGRWANLLRVVDQAGTANDWFVRAEDVTPLEPV
ncbi:MAG: hypothetical protein IT318_23845 [Anaerolineales bacterium]|nr:hypothetical protein [Anaerolineales bacterium]